jgi:hypothetical protein
MNSTAKIIIAALISLLAFLWIYSFIKAREADKLSIMLIEEQQISLQEKERARLLSEQASNSAADAIESAARAYEAQRMAKIEIEECEKMRK